MNFDLRITGHKQFSLVQCKGSFTSDVFSCVVRLLEARAQQSLVSNLIFDLSEASFPDGKAGAVRMAMKSIVIGTSVEKSNVALICCHNMDYLKEMTTIYQRITEETQLNLQVVSTQIQANEWLSQQIDEPMDYETKMFECRFCEKNHYTDVKIEGSVSIAELNVIQQLMHYRYKSNKNPNVFLDLTKMVFIGSLTEVMKRAMKQNVIRSSGVPALSVLVCSSEQIKQLGSKYRRIARDNAFISALFQSRVKAREWMNQYILDNFEKLQWARAQ